MNHRPAASPENAQHRRLRSFAPLDALIIVAMLIGALLFLPAAQHRSPQTVTVYRGDAPVAHYPLNEDRIFTIRGFHGAMDIGIEDGGVRVVRTDCPQGICKRTGAVKRPHSQIVCAPNHIVIIVDSPERQDEWDAVAK